MAAIPPELNPEFRRILLEDGKEQYAALLRELAATAILLSALGVPPEDIDMTNVESLCFFDGSCVDGSMEGYLREGLGFTDAEIEHLRDQLLN